MKINKVLLGIGSWNSVAGIVISLKVGQLWNVVQFVVDTRDIFLFQRVLTNWLIQPPVQWVLKALSTGIKPSWHELYYSSHLLSRTTMIYIHCPYAFMAFTEATLSHLCFFISETSFEEDRYDECDEWTT